MRWLANILPVLARGLSAKKLSAGVGALFVVLLLLDAAEVHKLCALYSNSPLIPDLIQ
jgi:hypothetical protein